MAKLPEPPSVAELSKIRADVHALPKGALAWRVYFRGGRHPTTWNGFRSFGPLSSSRFDHHDEPPRLQGKAILYVALAGPTCLAEVFQETRLIDRTARSPWLVAFETDRPLKLLDLTGTWPTRAGASMALNTGRRDRARRWAAAIYEGFPDLEGLHYPSSMRGNRPCIALNDRATDALPTSPLFHRPLSDPTLLRVLKNAAADIGYGLL
ncbi:MAG: RES family NAD+ phosphorylase [Planctomycetota bacterium]